MKVLITDPIAEEGIEILRYYIDKGASRMKPWRERPGAKEMVEFLEKGGKDIVDCVLIFDFTRLGASMLDILNLFNKLEKELGVKVISIHDEWLRTKDESLRKLLIAIFSWMAEMELKLRRERQQAAWEAGKQKGRPPKVPDEIILKYLKKYQGLRKKDICFQGLQQVCISLITTMLLSCQQNVYFRCSPI